MVLADALQDRLFFDALLLRETTSRGEPAPLCDLPRPTGTAWQGWHRSDPAINSRDAANEALSVRMGGVTQDCGGDPSLCDRAGVTDVHVVRELGGYGQVVGQ